MAYKIVLMLLYPVLFTLSKNLSFGAKITTVRRYFCATGSQEVLESHICDPNRYRDCPDNSDQTYCPWDADRHDYVFGGCLDSRERIVDQHSGRYLYEDNIIIGCDKCLCKPFGSGCSEDNALSCRKCHLVNRAWALVGDSRKDCEVGIDETEDATLIRDNVDWSLWNKLFYHGEWKCFGSSDHQSNDFVPCNAGSSAPFLHSFPMVNPVDCKLRGELKFWPCLQAKKCIREGQVCELRTKLRIGARCQYGYNEGAYANQERFCSRKICPKQRWACQSKCIPLHQPCLPKGTCYQKGFRQCPNFEGAGPRCLHPDTPCQTSCNQQMIYCPKANKCRPKSMYIFCPENKECKPSLHWKYSAQEKGCIRKCGGSSWFCRYHGQCIRNHLPCNGECRKGLTPCRRDGMLQCYRNCPPITPATTIRSIITPPVTTTTTTTTTTTQSTSTSTVPLERHSDFPESGRSSEEAYYPKDIRNACHPPNRLCTISSCVNGLGHACSHCLPPDKPCNGTCQPGLTFCPVENRCIPKPECQKLTSFVGSTGTTSESTSSSVTLISAILGVIGIVIILSMLVFILIKRKRGGESSARMRKVVKKEQVEYRVTVERVHAETNEYYGRDDEEDEEDEWAETVEKNPYYGEENMNYDLNVSQKNEYYGQ